MLTKKQISEIRKLHLKKHRDEMGLFLVEGTKSVSDLIRSPLETVALFATEAWLSSHPLPKQVEGVCISDKELERISCLQTPQEVLAVVKTPVFSTADLLKQQPILVLDGIRDPGNLGTIIRTADWFGFRQIVCSKDTVEFTNPKVIQATMGSFTRVKVMYADLCDFLKKEDKRRIFGTFMQGKAIGETEFAQSDILVIGNEGHGISPAVEALVSQKITIPAGVQTGERAESLNAALSTAIVLYQFKEKVKL